MFWQTMEMTQSSGHYFKAPHGIAAGSIRQHLARIKYASQAWLSRNDPSSQDIHDANKILGFLHISSHFIKFLQMSSGSNPLIGFSKQVAQNSQH